jgi:plasmid stabilization system protein ParE
MFKVRWTAEAEEDLEHIIFYYLENAGLRVAESIYAKIKEQVGSLRLFPERCRPGRVTGTREYVISRLPYIAIVDIDVDTVWILNVIHTARKYPFDR